MTAQDAHGYPEAVRPVGVGCLGDRPLVSGKIQGDDGGIVQNCRLGFIGHDSLSFLRIGTAGGAAFKPARLPSAPSLCLRSRKIFPLITVLGRKSVILAIQIWVYRSDKPK
jgi:hypothetical protein